MNARAPWVEFHLKALELVRRMQRGPLHHQFPSTHRGSEVGCRYNRCQQQKYALKVQIKREEARNETTASSIPKTHAKGKTLSAAFQSRIAEDKETQRIKRLRYPARHRYHHMLALVFQLPMFTCCVGASFWETQRVSF